MPTAPRTRPPGRGGRHVSAALALVALAVVAGCTRTRATARPSSTPSPPPPPAATLRVPDQPTTVIAAGSARAQAMAVSQALFRSAPVVVVAQASDPAGLAAAGTDANRIGAPVLLAGTASLSSPALAAELTRLHPRAVLAVGAAAAGLAAALPHERVVTHQAQLPRTRRPGALAAVSLLVNQRDASAGEQAAIATAHAAGASVVAVSGTDPRADPGAISALAAQPPAHVLALGADFGPQSRLATRVASAATGAQLPGGGQVFFPGRRLLALYGHPGTPSLGALGDQGLAASIARAEQLAAAYQPLSHVPVVPAFDLLATVAQGSPGPDGTYSAASSVAALQPWVEQAGAHGLYVVLDLQPGRANLLTQAQRYASLLALPYVGLALDPEWKLGPTQVPLQQIGTVDATEVNSVIRWLAQLTQQHHLPQKLLLLHQFRLSMIGHESSLDLSHDSLAVAIQMDGQGAPAVKDSTWHQVVAAAPKGIWLGWKDFYREDHPTDTPAQTLAHTPRPSIVSYQ